jgi:hypothetical protein
MTRLIALNTTYRPLGGVIKILDYVCHALEIGVDVEVYCPSPLDRGSPLFRIPRIAGLLQEVQFHEGFGFGVEPDDFVLFSWPTHYPDVLSALSPEADLTHVIHIVQNTRHANPRWLDGYAYRLLSQPITRIMITEQVLEATRHLVSPASKTRLIMEGHDWEYFHLARAGGLTSPIRVAYTTWKSKVGERVAAGLHDDHRFKFRGLNGEADWQTLRELYQWCDVFLASPRAQEGLYLPGLEAFAAGAILITPDVEGNMAYCDFDLNCIEVAYDSEGDYVEALLTLVNRTADSIEKMREHAYSVLPRFGLEFERQGFSDLLEDLGHGGGS